MSKLCWRIGTCVPSLVLQGKLGQAGHHDVITCGLRLCPPSSCLAFFPLIPCSFPRTWLNTSFAALPGQLRVLLPLRPARIGSGRSTAGQAGTGGGAQDAVQLTLCHEGQSHMEGKGVFCVYGKVTGHCDCSLRQIRSIPSTIIIR
jgi:hypothetical protein